VKLLGTSQLNHESTRLQDEIAALRGELSDSLSELDRRRRELLDVPRQIQEHAGIFLFVTVGAGALVAGAVGYAIHVHRRERRFGTRARHLREAVQRMSRHPERVANGEPNIAWKVLAAGLTALASTLAKRLVERAVLPERAANKESRLLTSGNSGGRSVRSRITARLGAARPSLPSHHHPSPAE
jgi:hypothetical protein